LVCKSICSISIGKIKPKIIGLVNSLENKLVDRLTFREGIDKMKYFTVGGNITSPKMIGMLTGTNVEVLKGQAIVYFVCG